MTRLFERQKRDVSLTSPPQWLLDYLGAGETVSGESVTVTGSLSVPAVLGAFTILAEDTASLPLILYRRMERGKERATSNPYYALMHDAPNPEHTSMVFREFILGHMLGWGNFYAQVIYDGRGRAVELWPLKPSRMEVFREPTGERKYLYTLENGSKRAFRASDILHIPAFGFDGLVGYSRVAMARNSIAMAFSAEKYAGRVFQNDARPSVVVKHPGSLTDEAYKRLRETWNQSYQGAGNAGKAAILEEGMDVAAIGFPPKDAMFIEQQEWSVTQVSRVFRIPPHMLGQVNRSTSWGSGIEQQELGYLSHTLRPWLVRIEQQLNKDLLLEAERKLYFYEHLTDGMLRTDITARFGAYAQAITNGWMTRNEAREKENMNPLKGLDEPLVPLNMQGADEPDPEPNPGPNPQPLPLGEGEPDEDEEDDVVRGFVREAAERIVRREVNEVQDAVKRWLDKGKPEKFTAWLEQFYRSDLPQFILKTLEPMRRDVSQVTGVYCLTHGQIVARDLEERRAVSVETWQERMPELLTNALMGEEIASSLTAFAPRNDGRQRERNDREEEE